MTSRTSKKILNILEEELKKRGNNPRFFDFFHKLFQIQLETEKSIGNIKPGLSKKDIINRQENGIPLLGYDDLSLDWSLLNKTFAGIAAVFTEFSDLFGGLSNSLNMLDSQKSLSSERVRAWYKGDKLSTTIAAGNTDEYLLLDTLIQTTLKPFLIRHSEALVSSVEQEKWRRNGCPICGGKPDIAYLDVERGSRWLVCSRCDTEWVFQRLQCPYCGNEDQSKMGYLTDEDEIYRLYTCENCHKYLKVIDLKKADSEVLMPLERILTLDMDRQAQENGYKPGYSEDRPDTSD